MMFGTTIQDFAKDPEVKKGTQNTLSMELKLNTLLLDPDYLFNHLEFQFPFTKLDPKHILHTKGVTNCMGDKS